MHALKHPAAFWCLITVMGLHHSFAAGRAWAETAAEVVPETVEADVATCHEDDDPSPTVSAGFIAPHEIQCRAAQASPAGNLLTAEQAAVETPRRGRRGGEAHASCVRRSMLGLAAQEARNRDAGTALLLYWSLAEAIHSQPLLHDAIDSAEHAIADHATVARRGLDIPIDATALVTRKLALQDNMISLETVIETLSDSLRLASDLPPVGISTARPGADESLLHEVPDVDSLVAEAMSSRPELRMLRMLQANLDADTAPVARTALAQISPALGGSDGATPSRLALLCLRGHGGSDHETATVARELRQLRNFREAAVADEVRRAARECSGNAERAAMARERLASTEQALADLRAKQPSDGSDAFSIHAAELEVAAAKRTVIERLAAWERSRVTLWQAQGILARQCGHGGH